MAHLRANEKCGGKWPALRRFFSVVHHGLWRKYSSIRLRRAGEDTTHRYRCAATATNKMLVRDCPRLPSAIAARLSEDIDDAGKARHLNIRKLTAMILPAL
jgi:hypothetical protein